MQKQAFTYFVYVYIRLLAVGNVGKVQGGTTNMVVLFSSAKKLINQYKGLILLFMPCSEVPVILKSDTVSVTSKYSHIPYYNLFIEPHRS